MPVQAKPKYTQTSLALFSLVALLAIVAVVAIIAWGPKPLPTSTPAVVNRVLLNGTITVNVGLYYIEFSIPKAFNVKISGTFAVSSGNSVRVLIYNSTDFGGAKGVIYDSGVSTGGNIEATPVSGGGTYYIVYDNNFQTTAVSVNTQVTLSYLYT